MYPKEKELISQAKYYKLEDPQSNATLPMLNADLKQKEFKSLFIKGDRNSELSSYNIDPEALQNLEVLTSNDPVKQQRLNLKPIQNPYVISELTKDGSDIKDWEKVSTTDPVFIDGRRWELHFYRNVKTGEINKNVDFKVKISEHVKDKPGIRKIDKKKD